MEKFTKPETGAISAMYHWLFISLSCFLLTNVRSLRCILIYPLSTLYALLYISTCVSEPSQCESTQFKSI